MAAGAVLGAVHAFEADHVAAVSAFISREPRARHAMGHGVRWAAGHGAAVLLAGALLAGWLLQVGSRSGELLVRAAMGLAGLVSLGVGVVWLVRS